MSTALELSRKDWQHYLDAARRRPKLPEPPSSFREERERLPALVRYGTMNIIYRKLSGNLVPDRMSMLISVLPNLRSQLRAELMAFADFTRDLAAQ
jgi:hypothetical protein